MGWYGEALILCKHVDDYCHVKACTTAEPVEMAYNMTEVCLGFEKDGRRQVGGLWNAIDGISRTVGCFGWCIWWKVEGGEQCVDGCFLGEVNVNVAGRVDRCDDFVVEELCRYV